MDGVSAGGDAQLPVSCDIEPKKTGMQCAVQRRVLTAGTFCYIKFQSKRGRGYPRLMALHAIRGILLRTVV